jgi:hypothetical protein
MVCLGIKCLIIIQLSAVQQVNRLLCHGVVEAKMGQRVSVSRDVTH